MNKKQIRALRFIRQSISTLGLQLKGRTVLTEVGSNYYVYTLIIPLFAGIEKGMAWTAETSYGSAVQIAMEARELRIGLDRPFGDPL